jgi:S1-C subfamily serine protease
LLNFSAWRRTVNLSQLTMKRYFIRFLAVPVLLSVLLAALGFFVWHTLTARPVARPAPVQSKRIPVVLPSLDTLSSVVERTENSIVKLEGEGCGGTLAGSGIVVSPDLILTSAHVIAGTHDTQVITSAGTLAATPVYIDPSQDVALLRADAIPVPALAIARSLSLQGTQGIIIGYPGDGGIHIEPGVVALVNDTAYSGIYNQTETELRYYQLDGKVTSGNSGGAFIDKNGQVVGLVFAVSESGTTGYARVLNDLPDGIAVAEYLHDPVNTGECAAASSEITVPANSTPEIQPETKPQAADFTGP